MNNVEKIRRQHEQNKLWDQSHADIKVLLGEVDRLLKFRKAVTTALQFPHDFHASDDYLVGQVVECARCADELADAQIDAARYRWLANNCDGNEQDDFTQWLAGNVASRERIDEMIDAMMSTGNK